MDPTTTMDTDHTIPTEPENPRKALLYRINRVINVDEFESTLEKWNLDVADFQLEWASCGAFENWPTPYREALLAGEAALEQQGVLDVTRQESAGPEVQPYKHPFGLPDIPNLEWLKTVKAATREDQNEPGDLPAFGEERPLTDHEKLYLQYASLWLSYTALRRKGDAVLRSRRQATGYQSLVLTNTLDILADACAGKVPDLTGNLS